MELMDNLIPHSIDTIITDPPYGTTRLAWDHAIDLDLFWDKANRAIKPNGVIVMFSQQPFTTRLINSNREHFRYELIWRKSSPVGFLDAKIRPLRIHENILIFCDHYRGVHNKLRSVYNPQFTAGKPYVRTRSAGNRAEHYGNFTEQTTSVNEGKRYPVDVLDYSNRTNKADHYHPTQKPVDLMRWLVLTYTNPGDEVLDPYAGSGSTGVACALTGRSFVGYELDPHYAEVACARVQDVLSRKEVE